MSALRRMRDATLTILSPSSPRSQADDFGGTGPAATDGKGLWRSGHHIIGLEHWVEAPDWFQGLEAAWDE